MALKIRRGTTAERGAMTGANPALAEPIWVTDKVNINGENGTLYIGDGATSGGIAVNPPISIAKLTDVDPSLAPATGQVLAWNTSNARFEASTLNLTTTIGALTDVDVTGVVNNKILKYNASTTNWEVADEDFASFNFDTQLASKSIDGLGDVSTSGADEPTPGQYLVWDDTNSQWKPGDLDLANASIVNLNADLKGSVFGDDSTLLVDGISSTVRLYNGVMDITADSLTSSTGNVEVSNKTESTSTVLEAYNRDEATAIRVNGLNGNTSANISGFSINGYYGGFDGSGSELKITSGNYIGELSALAFDPDFDGNGTGKKVLSSLILFRSDPTEAIANDTAKGQIEFVTNAGTGTTPVAKTMLFDAKGQLAVNRTSARSTLDVEGVMTLEPQTAAPATPVIGMIAVANKTNWDPASYSGSTPYPVFYTGAAWVAMIA
jgi:hypothetical protein